MGGFSIADTLGVFGGGQKPTPRYPFVAPNSPQEKAQDTFDLEFQKKMGVKTPELQGRAFDPIKPDTLKSLTDLGNKGTLALDGFSTYGKSQLVKLQSEGLLKFKELNTSTSATVSNLSEKGKASLKSLQDKGLISVGGLQKDGTAQVTALNADGKKALEALKKDGTLSMSDFHTEGKVQITSLSQQGAQSLIDLKKGGSLSLEGMNTDSTGQMKLIRTDTATNNNNIFLEHKGIGATIGKIWSDFWDWIKSHLPSWLGGSGGGGTATNPNMNVTRDTDVRGNTGATADSINKSLRGKLSGYGDDYIKAGKATGIDPAFLASVSMAETGNGSVVTGNNVGGMMGSNGLMQFGSMSQGITAMANNLKSGYIDQGLTTPAEIQKKYAPDNAGNDPTGLNSNWTKNVTSFYQQLAGNAGSANGVSGSNSAFHNWQSNVTSPYGDPRTHNGKTTYHSGLDIGLKQGTTLNAIAGGKLTGIIMDDGGQYDPDHKANTRIGGSQVTVTMPNGKSYNYEHLSQVNSDLLSKYEGGNHAIPISVGQNLGKSGGDPKIAGSGDPNYTTGSHLHLGYNDANGALENPANLLNSLGSFDTGGYTGTWGGSEGKLGIFHQKELMLNATDTPNFLEALDTSKEIVRQSKSGGAVGGGSARITVDVNVTGNKASLLNNMTIATIKNLVQQGIQAYKQQQLSINPTIVR